MTGDTDDNSNTGGNFSGMGSDKAIDDKG